MAIAIDKGMKTQIEWTPDVALVDDLKAKALGCPYCFMKAVIPLTLAQRKRQPDATTHVCHPAIGGCNQGFKLA